MDACSDRFFQRIDRTLQCFITIFSESRQFRKIGRCNKYSPIIIIFKSNLVTQHDFSVIKYIRISMRCLATCAETMNPSLGPS